MYVYDTQISVFMQQPEYFILLLLKDYPLNKKKLKQELLQSSFFNCSNEVKNWIEKLTNKKWIEDKDDNYSITSTGIKELIDQELNKD